MTQYENLILIGSESSITIYETHVKPNIKPYEYFYQIYDADSMDCIAYAFRCTRQQILSDLTRYAIHNIAHDYGTVHFELWVWTLLPDGTKHSVAKEEF